MDGIRKNLPLILFAFVLVACGTPVGSSKKEAAGYSTGSSDPAPPSSGGSGTVVDSAGFFVKVASNNSYKFESTLHATTTAYGSLTGLTSDIPVDNLTTECKIADGSSAGNDLLCVMEIEELDLYFSDISLQIHVPSDMCSYLAQSPYHFYAYKPGIGPSTVSYEKLADGTINDVTNSVNGAPSCSYDTTSEGGANCCLGTYALTITTYDSSGTPTTVTTGGNKWGGKVANCLDGPAMKTQTLSKDGYPLDDVYYVESTGKNFTYTIPKAIATSFGAGNTRSSNFWAANIYNPVADHGGAGSRPPALDIPSGLSVTDRYLPTDAYTWSCLNRAEDVIQRIRLFIREWDEHAIAAGGNPDSGYSAGTWPTEPSYPDQYIDDRFDWKDLKNLNTIYGIDPYPASYL